MRIIAILVLVVGAALAGGAMYYASLYFERYEQRIANSKPEGPQLVNVIVAKEKLDYGTRIVASEHLRWAALPEDALPEGVFTDATELLGPEGKRLEDKYSRFVTRTIEVNEPILKSKITGAGERQRMAMKLREGRRAFAIKIDAVSGVAGFVTPGDRVDIMLTRGGRDTLESVVILENILVIAVDQQTNDQRNRPVLGRTATVEVTPEEAQKLALAQQVGRLSLTLRGYGEAQANTQAGSPSERRAVDVRDLLGIEEEQQPERRQGPTVKVRKGGEISGEIEFE